MKKILSLALTLALALAILVVPVNAAGVPSAWAQASVDIAIARGLVPTALQDQYTQPITRAEFTALAVTFYEHYTQSEITQRVEFTDTTDVNVQKAAALGVVTGVGDGRFDPYAGLTREQSATMLARLATAVSYTLPTSAPTFNDSATISPWASAAVGQMQQSGIMGGTGDNTFSPAGSYTREQSIATILRLDDRVSGSAAPSQPEQPTPPPAPAPVTIPTAEISRMLKNPNYYAGQYVDKMPAKIFNIPNGGMYLQVNAGPDKVNTYITLSAPTTLAEGDYMAPSSALIPTKRSPMRPAR